MNGTALTLLRRYYGMRLFYRFVVAWSITLPVALLIVWLVQS